MGSHNRAVNLVMLTKFQALLWLPICRHTHLTHTCAESEGIDKAVAITQLKRKKHYRYYKTRKLILSVNKKNIFLFTDKNKTKQTYVFISQ